MAENTPPPGGPGVGFTVTSDPDTTTFGPATTGTTPREEGRPFRLLFVADLDPQVPPAAWDGERRVRAVDASSFRDVMRDWAPRVEVQAENRLGSSGRLTATITADSLDALAPGGIARQVPALATVAAARDALAEARDGRLGADALRDRLREAGVEGADALVDAVRAREGGAPPPPAGGDDPLARLFGLVDVDGSGAPPATSARDEARSGLLDALVGAAAGGAAPREIDRDAAGRLLGDLDGRLRAQVEAVLDHPDVRRLEAAWRGLKLLVDRLAFRKGARLEVLAAPKEALSEALHFQVLLPEHAAGADRDPLAAVVVDHAFTATLPEVDALADLAETGASLQVPVVATVAPAFFGLDGPADLGRLPLVPQLLQRPEYLPFAKLRARPEAGFLALALPPFLLRPAYGPDHPDRTLGFEGAAPLWGGGALLAAAAMAESHAATGWPTHLGGRRVGDLPVRRTRMGALPLAAVFGERVVADLAAAGFLAFSGPVNADHAVVGWPATVARPADGAPDARARASLPAALLTALAAHAALRLGRELAGLGEAEAAAELEARLRAFLRTGTAPLPDDAVTIQPLPEHETDEARMYGVRLWPPREVLPEGVGIVLGVEVPKHAASPPPEA